MAAEDSYANELVEPTPEQVAEWRVVDTPRQAMPSLVGSCPHCHHDCDGQLEDRVVQGGVLASAVGIDRVEPVTRLVLCNCTTDHGAPSGVRGGCGRYWLMTLTGHAGAWELHAERDMALLPAARALQDAIADQDRRVQASAEKWVGGMTALYGLFSLAGLATGKGATKGLQVWERVMLGGVLLAAVVAAAVSILLGYLAAYGWPRVTEIKTNEQLVKWYEDQRTYSRTAAGRLTGAVLAACGSLLLLMATTGLVWFLPRAG